MSIESMISQSETEKHLKPNRDLWSTIEHRMDKRDRVIRIRRRALSSAAAVALLTLVWFQSAPQPTSYIVEDFRGESYHIYQSSVIAELADLYRPIYPVGDALNG